MGAHADLKFQAEVLQDYVDQRMTPQEFAEHTGLDRNACYRILSGEQWIRTPRPDGFMYPWPEHAEGHKRVNDSSRYPHFVDVLTQADAEKWSIRKTSKALGVAPSSIPTVKRRLRAAGLWQGVE